MTCVLRSSLALVFLIAACVHNAVAAPDETGEGHAALWRMADADTTVYLYGTLHATKPGRAWFANDAAAALAASDVLYLEVEKNTPRATARQITKQMAHNAEGVTLSDMLDEGEQTRVRDAAVNNGVSWKALQKMRPWKAALTISRAALARSGVDVATGVEAHLLKEAARLGLLVRGFATLEEHAAHFADLSVEVQRHYLLYTLEKDREAADEFDALYEAWITGDVGKLAELAIGDTPHDLPEVYAVLMTDRNQLWADRLAELMEQETGTFFVAVGIGHLVGPDQIQRFLAEKGLVAERL